MGIKGMIDEKFNELAADFVKLQSEVATLIMRVDTLEAKINILEIPDSNNPFVSMLKLAMVILGTKERLAESAKLQLEKTKLELEKLKKKRGKNHGTTTDPS